MEKATSVFCYPNGNQFPAGDLSSATFLVRMLSNGFCLAVLSNEGKVLYLNQYAFPPNLSIGGKIETIENARPPFHSECGKAVFQLYTSINTQIPEAFYTENANDAIADLLINNSKKYVPVGEKIAEVSLYNLSLWDAVLFKKVKECFPNYELKTVLGALLVRTATRTLQEEAIVFVEDMNFTVVARNAKGLLACNSFDFETEADFLYYCLYFLRQLFLNAEIVPIRFCGNITTLSSLFTAVKKYATEAELLENGTQTIENQHYYSDIF
jgi:hypothetical protein